MYCLYGNLHQYQCLLHVLRGKAAECLTEITYSYPNIKDMGELLTIFGEEYKIYSKPSQFSSFLKAHQGDDESVIDWANRISELSQQASTFLGSSPELVEKQAVRKFIPLLL